MKRIPTEIRWEIMLFVPRKFLLNMFLVSKNWVSVQENDNFWKEYCFSSGIKGRGKGRSWKEMYQLSVNYGVRIFKKKKTIEVTDGKENKKIKDDNAPEDNDLTFKLLVFSRQSFGLCDTFIYRCIHSVYVKSSPSLGRCFQVCQVEDFVRKKEKCGSQFDLDIWNFRIGTAVRYRSLSPLMFRTYNGYLMALDLRDSKDLPFLKSAYKSILAMSDRVRDRKDFTVLIGLKDSNKTKIEVDSKEIEEFCEENGLKYFEVSLKEGVSVTLSMSYVIRKILDNFYEHSDTQSPKFNGPCECDDLLTVPKPVTKKRCNVQ